jgi:hypothetical protein
MSWIHAASNAEDDDDDGSGPFGVAANSIAKLPNLKSV